MGKRNLPRHRSPQAFIYLFHTTTLHYLSSVFILSATALLLPSA